MAFGILLEILLFLISFEIFEALAFSLFQFDVSAGLKPEHMLLVKIISVPASLLLIAGLMKVRGARFVDTGLAKPLKGWGHAARLGALSVVPMLLLSRAATALLSQWFDGPDQVLFDLSGRWSLGAFLLVGIFAGGVAEEIQFRGFLFRRFEQLFSTKGSTRGGRKLARLRAAWMTSLAFAGLHFYQGVAVMGAIFLVALCLQFLYLYSGRNLVPGILCHALFNSIQITFLWMAESS
jgi:membrane protease YdiL (CAAX protease family)